MITQIFSDAFELLKFWELIGVNDPILQLKRLKLTTFIQ